MWQPVFLAALADGSTEEGPATGGNISRAAARAEVNPVVAHYYRRIDPAFARAWAAAFEQGVDAVEGLSDYLTAHMGFWGVVPRAAHLRCDSGGRTAGC